MSDIVDGKAVEIQDTIRGRVARIMDVVGLSQGQFAARVGMTKGTMSKSMLDRRRFTVEDVVTIAAAFGVSTDWVLGVVESPGPMLEVDSVSVDTVDTDTVDTDADAVNA